MVWNKLINVSSVLFRSVHEEQYVWNLRNVNVIIYVIIITKKRQTQSHLTYSYRVASAVDLVLLTMKMFWELGAIVTYIIMLSLES